MFVEGDNSTSGIAVTGKMFMGAHIACNMLPQCDGWCAGKAALPCMRGNGGPGEETDDNL